MSATFDPHTLLDQAGTLLNSNRLSEAHGLCTRLLSADPRNIRALLLMAMIERRRERFDLAIDLARQVLRVDSQQTDAHLFLAAIMRDAKNPVKALEHIIQVLRSRPADHRVLMIASAIHFDLGDIPEAESALRRSIGSTPTIEAYLALGTLQEMQRKVAKAEEYFWRAVQLSPERISPWLEYAYVHRFDDQDPKLVQLEDFLRNSSLSSNERNSLKFALADVYDRMARYEDAFRLLQEANQEIARTVSFDTDQFRQATLETIKGYQCPPLPFKADTEACDHVPIFLIGPSRSGKSLVESLLEKDSGVIPLRESEALQTSFGQVLRSAGVREAYFLPALARIGPERLGDLVSHYVSLVRNIAPLAKFSINTLPTNNRYVGLILDVMPRAKVIFCRRNALDGCLKIYFRNYKTGNYYSYNLTWLAEYYTSYSMLLDHWRERYGDRILEVRYEDLILNPKATLESIRIFCGLSTQGVPQAGPLHANEIGHWRNYERWLTPLIDKLSPLGAHG